MFSTGIPDKFGIARKVMINKDQIYDMSNRRISGYPGPMRMCKARKKTGISGSQMSGGNCSLRIYLFRRVN
jgi:hypothetical protein